MIREIVWNEQRIALIVCGSFRHDGTKFFTPNEASLQLAFMQYPAGHCFAAHIHNRLARSVEQTQEVFVIRKGSVRVRFYSEAQEEIASEILSAGDVLLQVSGGHSFDVLEALEMYEIKQGPYAGNADKTYFQPLPSPVPV